MNAACGTQIAADLKTYASSQICVNLRREACGNQRLIRESYLIPSSSTSNTSVALGGMTPPAPRAP
jgi:hypothetical protein